MAKLINTLLGKIKGTLGDITFFQRGNEQHIKPRKLPHTKTKDVLKKQEITEGNLHNHITLQKS